MEIAVYDEKIGSERLTADELAAIGPLHLSAAERVEGVSGRAVDFLQWYAAWRSRHGAEGQPMPKRLGVRAADEFEASVPWAQLERALLLYRQEDGQPLKKGYPLRLYVPDGSSDCLNVKSVVQIRFLYEGDPQEGADYGFRNEISPDQLRKREAK
ncbi:hypothetical protein ACVNS2_07780 [Paenibacillus caseinilyticus]|uniref:Oxidoreductase molybdopterin-binding domain-containing protein n=1 Tax=Paenibacillus mucilaginosus K02 TaxID=997761 RepID=I0BDW9_9BACL|nr:hypothetical protein [Paenibacillus mucilaginosus]AFH60566.1 hypothetical protein B2K_07500 [Paenibacillus mucilaginosus K02]